MSLPWIQVDKAFLRSPEVILLGRRLGIGRYGAIGLCCDVWAWASDAAPDGRVDGAILDEAIGSMPGEASLSAAMLDVGLLVQDGDLLRICGWDRYRKVLEKAARDAEEKRGWRKNGAGTARAETAPRRGNGAGKSQIESQSQIEEKHLRAAPAPADKQPPADPRLKPLTDALCADFEEIRHAKYKHGGAKDALALKGLLPVATDGEIRGEWRRALTLSRDDWLSCSTLAQLASKWNDLTAPERRRSAL